MPFFLYFIKIQRIYLKETLNSNNKQQSYEEKLLLFICIACNVRNGFTSISIRW